MSNNVTLTAQDRKLVYAIFEQVDHMIAAVGAPLEAVMRVQLYLEQKRKELAMDVK